MRLIDNLEELEVGDYISRSPSMNDKNTIIFKVKVSTKKFIHVKVIKYYNHWTGRWKLATNYSNKEPVIFLKKVRKTKKKKLKHKLVTYNDNLIVFKLTEKEKMKVIKDKILESLEK